MRVVAHSARPVLLATAQTRNLVRAQAQTMSNVKWGQATVVLPPAKRGCHLITRRIEESVAPQMKDIKAGMANVFIQHTSASLTINENADPDVRADMETFLNSITPEGAKAPWRHTDEGYDDMPAHCKSSMFGCSLNIPITNGRFNLGTWQGIWLCEHRDSATNRTVVVTVQGTTESVA